MADGHQSASPPGTRVQLAASLVEALQAAGKCGPGHPLLPIVRKEASGAFGPQPPWRLPLLIKGLQQSPDTARCTAFSSRCPDGGGPWTRWGTRVRRGICAADPHYWGPGSVIWLGAPVEAVLVVEDTGSAVRGRDRFDVCFGDDAAACNRFGVQRIAYYPLHVVPPKSNWGTRPRSWRPVTSSLTRMLSGLTASAATG
jgi:3D (Asp-Asp-Asp) domain-containing protein